MSRTNQTESLPNPTTRWFEWSGGSGCVTYYDKEAEKKQEVPFPFKFLVLDQLATVSGFHEASESGIIANEVRRTPDEDLVVKTHKGLTLARGRWSEIKSQVKEQGGGFTASVYIAYEDQGQWKLGNIRLRGSGLSAWLDFKD